MTIVAGFNALLCVRLDKNADVAWPESEVWPVLVLEPVLAAAVPAWKWWCPPNAFDKS